MARLTLTALAGLLLLPAAVCRGEGRPIPQDPRRQEQRFRDMLEWNRRTLGGAYEKVGKKDPRWDRHAREALEAAARVFSYAIDPYTRQEEIYAAARKAIDAGCDAPMILYLYARSSYKPNYPGAAELERRYAAAAAAMEHSAYPPFRRFIALYKAGLEKADRPNAPPDVRAEAARLLDAALALLPRSVAEDERNPDMENNWIELPQTVIEGHRLLTGDYQAAFNRVDAVLAKDPALKAIRLQVKGDFLVRYAWEARGTGFANTVTEEGWKKFGERLDEARKALEEAWELQPGTGHAATRTLTVVKGLGGDRDEMEKWFERAMKADGNNRDACQAKLDFLDPKWHGTPEDVLAFGRACRDTKNWRVGITLLVADAHRRVAEKLPLDKQREYLFAAEVWDDVRTVYEEYLKHYPANDVERSRYAAYCHLCGQPVEADKQFRMLGDNLVWGSPFPEAWMKRAKAYSAQEAAKARTTPEPVGQDKPPQ